MHNKRAQVAETITWIVATLIIVLVLISFIFVSSLLAKAKNISYSEIKLEKESFNWIESKINFVYEEGTSSNKIIIDNWRKTNE